nr:MAG TPA: hypothetical protein [Caudoviricetes sp.]
MAFLYDNFWYDDVTLPGGSRMGAPGASGTRFHVVPPINVNSVLTAARNEGKLYHLNGSDQFYRFDTGSIPSNVGFGLCHGSATWYCVVCYDWDHNCVTMVTLKGHEIAAWGHDRPGYVSNTDPVAANTVMRIAAGHINFNTLVRYNDGRWDYSIRDDTREPAMTRAKQSNMYGQPSKQFYHRHDYGSNYNLVNDSLVANFVSVSGYHPYGIGTSPWVNINNPDSLRSLFSGNYGVGSQLRSTVHKSPRYETEFNDRSTRPIKVGGRFPRAIKVGGRRVKRMLLRENPSSTKVAWEIPTVSLVDVINQNGRYNTVLTCSTNLINFFTNSIEVLVIARNRNNDELFRASTRAFFQRNSIISPSFKRSLVDLIYNQDYFARPKYEITGPESSMFHGIHPTSHALDLNAGYIDASPYRDILNRAKVNTWTVPGPNNSYWEIYDSGVYLDFIITPDDSRFSTGVRDRRMVAFIRSSSWGKGTGAGGNWAGTGGRTLPPPGQDNGNGGF